MEGIMKMQAALFHQSGNRNKEVVENSQFKLMDTIILGYKESPFTLIVGGVTNLGVKPIASVNSGFNPDEEEELRNIFQEIILREEHGVTLIEPWICCKIGYSEKTQENYLQDTSFEGFQFNKKPIDCILA